MAQVNRIFRRRIHFRKPALTSRNSFLFRDIFLIELADAAGNSGYGECAPLVGLSADDRPDYMAFLLEYCRNWNAGSALETEAWPSIRFGMETALRDLDSQASHVLFGQNFTDGVPIAINGLVWMADFETMLLDARTRADEGYTCLKLKIGALDFGQELHLLAAIREHYDAESLQIRLDANGAFGAGEALAKLKELAQFDIHSLEQPIRAGQAEASMGICAESPIPIALDEELIGRNPLRGGFELLKQIQPAYLILKPNLLGGFSRCNAWVELAESLGIGWWATSALESNLGLNAIAQWTASHKNTLAQGLGTGSLYRDNLASPLYTSPGFLHYNPIGYWGLDEFLSSSELIADAGILN